MTLAHELAALVLVAVGVSGGYLWIDWDVPRQWFTGDPEVEDASETAGTWTPYVTDPDRSRLDAIAAARSKQEWL